MFEQLHFHDVALAKNSNQRFNNSSCQLYFGECYIEFKQTNQIFSPSKITQSIKVERRTCGRN